MKALLSEFNAYAVGAGMSSHHLSKSKLKTQYGACKTLVQPGSTARDVRLQLFLEFSLREKKNLGAQEHETDQPENVARVRLLHNLEDALTAKESVS